MKRMFLVVMLAALAMGAGEYRIFGPGDQGVTNTATLNVVETGDTAQELGLTATAVDSFVYIDTLVVAGGLTDSVEVTWTSPLQTMRITPGVEAAYAYVCSLVFAGGNLGFTYTSPATTTIDTVISHVVDSINALAGITDTVVAEDSTTYIKITSKFSQEILTARFSMIVADSLADTASEVTTVATVMDGMVAAINAAACSAYVTASDSTDSLYIISDDAGLAFNFYIGDTATDTSAATPQANVTSWSSDTGSTWLGSVEGFKTMWARLILNPGRTATQGVGNSDSGYIWLYGKRGGERILMDSALAASLPCTLTTMVHSAVGDTSLWGDLEYKWRLADTASDSTFAVSYPLWWIIQLK